MKTSGGAGEPETGGQGEASFRKAKGSSHTKKGRGRTEEKGRKTFRLRVGIVFKNKGGKTAAFEVVPLPQKKWSFNLERRLKREREEGNAF